MSGAEPPAGIAVLPPVDADLPFLGDIDAGGTLLLAAHGFPYLDLTPVSIAELRAFLASDRGFVVEFGDGRPVGYAIAGPVAGLFWLKALSVDPDVQRRGVGSALLDSVVAHAQGEGFSTVALSTFREVPFNAPFYARRGFAVVDVSSEPIEIRRQFSSEVPEGAEEGDRVFMVNHL